MLWYNGRSSQRKGGHTMKNIYMIGNTHFDPVWLWTWDDAMASIHSTFRSALDRMKEDEDFIYSFATPPVFEWIKKTDPEMFDEIKARVKEGRWDICEGWWLQPDCFSATGESYARHSLYGQRYMKKNFDKFSSCVFNIDSFGHNSQTPQILRKSHMNYYCMVRPEVYHFPITEPYFKWTGKDGSELMAFRAGQFHEICNKNMIEAVNITEQKMADISCDEMMIYGVTNHGGAPTKKAIADIHYLNETKPYELKFSTVEGYFKAQGRPACEVNGEMLTKDFGPYTDNYFIKGKNSKAEYAVLNAEKASVIANKVLGYKYDKEKLTYCWQDIMFNQFHDILGGTCIKQAYSDSNNQLGRAIFTANEITQYSLQAVTRKINTPGTNPENPWNVVVWNLNPHEYSGYIESEVQWLHEFEAYSGGIVLEDADNNRYECQIIQEGSVIPGFRSRFVFKAKIPAMGYKCFRVVKLENDDQITKNRNIRKLNTEFFEVEFDCVNGFIKNIINKANGRAYTDILRPECYEDDGDTWCFNTSSYGEKIDEIKLIKLEVAEDGIHRTTFKASYKFRNSLITLYYTFYNSKNYFDVKYIVNWNEREIVLKLVSDTECSNLNVSSPFASENRPDNCYDLPMGEWISMSDENGGISFISDTLFSYTKEDSKLGLSILRSCIFGDLRLGELDKTADYPIMEQGICEGKVRIVIHEKDFSASRIPDMSSDFCNGPIVICEANHKGTLPAENKYVSVVSDSVQLSALKQHEDGTDDIVRLFENAGKHQEITLYYFGREFKIDMKPYEIKTLKISKIHVNEVLITED